MWSGSGNDIAITAIISPTTKKTNKETDSTDYQRNKNCKILTFFFYNSHFYAGKWKTFEKSDSETKRNHNVSDFESNFFRLVRFSIKRFTTRQILNKVFYIMSDFKKKFFWKNQIFEKIMHWKIHASIQFTP